MYNHFNCCHTRQWRATLCTLPCSSIWMLSFSLTHLAELLYRPKTKITSNRRKPVVGRSLHRFSVAFWSGDPCVQAAKDSLSTVNKRSSANHNSIFEVRPNDAWLSSRRCYRGMLLGLCFIARILKLRYWYLPGVGNARPWCSRARSC